jgi:hypothetical protein
MFIFVVFFANVYHVRLNLFFHHRNEQNYFTLNKEKYSSVKNRMNRYSDIDCSFKRLIESQIEELPYYIKIDNKHCRYPSDHGLSRDESAAIYIYTME